MLHLSHSQTKFCITKETSVPEVQHRVGDEEDGGVDAGRDFSGWVPKIHDEAKSVELKDNQSRHTDELVPTESETSSGIDVCEGLLAKVK